MCISITVSKRLFSYDLLSSADKQQDILPFYEMVIN
jgi:hypothetical protein